MCNLWLLLALTSHSEPLLSSLCSYNYADRDKDRNYVLENGLKESDVNAYNTMRRWGVRFVLGENMQRHARSNEQSDFYLDGQLKRVFTQGRFDILEVQGYGFPPN
jgi:hypothetical protein